MVASLPKTKAKAAPASQDPLLSRIAKLESSLLAQPQNPNPLLPLIALARHDSPQVLHKAVWALHRVFIKLIDENLVGGITGPGGSRGSVEVEGVETGREVKTFVRERLLEYVEILGGLVRDSEEALRASALPLLFSLLPPLSASTSQSTNPIIHVPYLRMVLQYLLSPSPTLRGASLRSASSSTDLEQKWEIVQDNQIDLDEGILPPDVLEMVHSEYWAKYDDLRWIFFREAAYALDGSIPLEYPDNLLGQLLPLNNLPRKQEDLNTFFVLTLTSPPKSASEPLAKKIKTKSGKKAKTEAELDKLPDWMAAFEEGSEEEDDTAEVGSKRTVARTSTLSMHASIHSVASHTNLYSTLWETVFSRVPLDEVWTRRILVGLHGSKGILSHIRADRRIRVADWLGSLVDGGGALAMLAMNGLFVLMTQYNLDYPNFYQRLYGLLDCDVLHVKYRARFFRLLDTFLSSSLLPAALVASFIKRLSRLALAAPPAAIIMLIPFIYNLFKRHPGCMIMIQRHTDDSDIADPYDAEDPSPLTSRAISSSCWELAALQHHYLASVSTLAKVFIEVFTKPEYNMEDFLDHGYNTLFETEINRKLKYPPALNTALEAPDATTIDLFPGADKIHNGDDGEVDANENDIVSKLWTF
ncbi:CBF/Mak21 family-domain-containing protein [Naematelia encephala]|uniref:CBF/Mak21 family-domain-containing protein n=1 Tax=Naematelia encephala TaxID=71784 RepID=A0A1Y2AMI7_9TREE|nr:CBF/Mak21 family-domain-containing protein [Naematelia encephala]